MKWTTISLLVLLLPCPLRAQSANADVARSIAMIQNGQAEVVRGEIPALLARYPNHPGVLYLQALTTSEGAEAVRIYQSIVDNFPSSEWADDALFKVYQFYYNLGLYRTAEIKMAQLKKSYPDSKYLTSAAETDTQQMTEEKTDTAASTLAQMAEKFTLQVGAYTTAANAEKQRSIFEAEGYPVEVITRVKEGRSLFLVLVGSYGGMDEAREQGAAIRKKYKIDSIVTAK